jgi:hypothetical protein
VRLLKKFARPVTLEMLREHASGDVEGSRRAASRQSTLGDAGHAAEWKFIHRLARESDPIDDRARRSRARCAYLLLAIPSTMYILGLGLTPTWRSNMATKKKAKKKASKKK